MAHIGHNHIVNFAQRYVDLREDDVKEYREQANRLRDRLDSYLKENPDFSLKKMLLSGSLAKGTALKDIDDIDLAVYVSFSDAPADMSELRSWLAEKLRSAFPNFKPDQVVENPSTITVSFISSGLRMDVVPILYEGDEEWRGHMIYDDGTRVLTSIPLHINFIRSRKQQHGKNYAQIIRLLKYWVKKQKEINENFRFKSFMVELLVAHMVNNGLELDNYPEALAQIFAYIATDAFATDIVFDDHYDPKLCVDCMDPIRIWDPVNHENNTAQRYTEEQKEIIIDAALEAGDAIDSALCATTKTEALRYWRKVFGPTFSD